MGKGEEIRGEVYSGEEEDEENAAEEEHFGAAEMPSGESHGDEKNHRRGQNAELGRGQHWIRPWQGSGG